MTEFKDKARETVEEASEKAKEVLESATDIARDQLDTFKKLDKKKQKILLAIGGALLVVVLAWLFWPASINVTLEMQIVDVTIPGFESVGNAVIVANDEEEDLGESTIKLDNTYEVAIDNVPAGETVKVYVTDFRRGGDENGSAPTSDYVPKRITLSCDLGMATRKYSKK